MPLCFGIFLISVIIYQGGSAPPDTSNYRTTKAKRARSTTATGTRLSEISVICRLPMPLGFGAFPIRVSIYQGASVSPDTSNYRTPEAKLARSTAETGIRCLEISFMRRSSRPLVSGLFLIRVNIYMGGSVSPYTSNYRRGEGKSARKTSGTGTRLSGNIRCVWSPHAISFRDFPDQCKHIPGRLCSA